MSRIREKKLYTPREIEIAAIKVKNPGISQADVAKKLAITPQAVSHHIHSIESKWAAQATRNNQ